LFGKNKNILRQPKVYNPPAEQKSFKLPKFIWILVIIVILFLAILYLMFFSPVFQIRNIVIEGSPPEEVKTLTESFKGKNIFLFNSSQSETDLINNRPEILSVKIYKGIPDILKMKFNCRVGKIIWQTQNQYFLIDEQGVAFKEITSPKDLPKVVDNKNLDVKIPIILASPNFINFIKNLPSKIEQNGLKIDYFAVNETTFQVDVITEEGIKIIFDTTRPLTEQMDAFQKVWNDHKNEIKEYVDVRVEGWAYYK
jgi:cell division septal protein FtsQ